MFEVALQIMLGAVLLLALLILALRLGLRWAFRSTLKNR